MWAPEKAPLGWPQVPPRAALAPLGTRALGVGRRVREECGMWCFPQPLRLCFGTGAQNRVTSLPATLVRLEF